jgi:hypothetical protein
MVSEVREWFVDLQKSSPKDADRIAASIDLLSEIGPTLGRPLVDRIEGSSLSNLKELRPTSRQDAAIRILFAFDPSRNAVLLIAGDKAGNWKKWYQVAIPLAEERFEAWINGYSVEE